MKLIRIKSRYRALNTSRDKRGSLSKSDSVSSDQQENPKSHRENFKKCFISALTLFIFLLVVYVSIFLANRYFVNAIYAFDKTAELGSHKLITTTMWGGNLLSKRTLRHPVDYIVISHTGGTFCRSGKSCALQLRKAQDIDYNFFIGGDSNIYYGSGWDLQSVRGGDNIEISFMGNFSYNKLTDEMIDAAQSLINHGVVLGKVSKYYKLLSCNQTDVNRSSGVNIYKEIKNWDHFYDKGVSVHL